jgi:hypothetical protein
MLTYVSENGGIHTGIAPGIHLGHRADFAARL